jgi:hypothetical protein
MSDEPIIHRDAPSWDGLRTAAVGCFRYPDIATGTAFLRAACATLKDEGFGAVIGPMDGNTWRRYRLPIWSDGSSAFAMEPDAGPHDLASYQAAGFDIAETHVSATAAPGTRGWGDAARGVTIASWDGKSPETLLAEAHRLVSQGFANTPFYTPVPAEHFIASYLPLLAQAEPRFILRGTVADGRIVGLTLAFPDPIRRGAVVLKTYVGIVPGVGRAMADHVHRLAGELGFKEVVHALMRDGIVSQAQSRKFGGTVFRRYALMGKNL